MLFDNNHRDCRIDTSKDVIGHHVESTSHAVKSLDAKRLYHIIEAESTNAITAHQSESAL